MIYNASLGKPTIMELNFPKIPDEDIKVGQWIILWDEIPIRKIGPNIYEVYPDADLPKLSAPANPRLIDYEGIAKSLEEPTFRTFTPPFLEDVVRYDEKKYIRTSKGSRKKQPWESPKFYM